jgi:death on curing protein
VTPLFLRLDDVLALHQEQIRLFGGASGIRDLGLLESAIGTPAATFDGAFLHGTLFEMAAAYLHSICRNHPFIDGNKRTAVSCALTFLALNAIWIEASEDEFFDLVIGVAQGVASKAEVAVFLERNAAS